MKCRHVNGRSASVSATACSKVTDGRQNLLVPVLLEGCLKWTVATCFFLFMGHVASSHIGEERGRAFVMFAADCSLWNSNATSCSKYYVQITHVFVYHICMLPLGKPQEVHMLKYSSITVRHWRTFSCYHLLSVPHLHHAQ